MEITFAAVGFEEEKKTAAASLIHQMARWQPYYKKGQQSTTKR